MLIFNFVFFMNFCFLWQFIVFFCQLDVVRRLVVLVVLRGRVGVGRYFEVSGQGGIFFIFQDWRSIGGRVGGGVWGYLLCRFCRLQVGFWSVLLVVLKGCYGLWVEKGQWRKLCFSWRVEFRVWIRVVVLKVGIGRQILDLFGV